MYKQQRWICFYWRPWPVTVCFTEILPLFAFLLFLLLKYGSLIDFSGSFLSIHVSDSLFTLYRLIIYFFNFLSDGTLNIILSRIGSYLQIITAGWLNNWYIHLIFWYSDMTFGYIITLGTILCSTENMSFDIFVLLGLIMSNLIFRNSFILNST